MNPIKRPANPCLMYKLCVSNPEKFKSNIPSDCKYCTDIDEVKKVFSLKLKLFNPEKSEKFGLKITNMAETYPDVIEHFTYQILNKTIFFGKEYNLTEEMIDNWYNTFINNENRQRLEKLEGYVKNLVPESEFM